MTVVSFKNKASAIQVLIETLTTRDLTRDEMRIDRIEISLMKFVQNLLTVN
jgi:hypothetical protein